MTGTGSRKVVERVTPSPMGERFIFWSLVFLSFATFAPCVILPEWRAYEALEVARQREQHRLEVVLQAIDKEERLLEAMRSDPVIIDRVVQRDLRYQRAGERVVRVALPDLVFEDRDGRPFSCFLLLRAGPAPAAPPWRDRTD